MRILYAIQGTGNGHVSRAREIVPILQKHHEVDVLISGTQADISVPFAVRYQFKGLSFVFGKAGGIDLLETYKRGNLRTLFADANALPVQDYDLVLNDFEPVSAWACYQKNMECISLSHQSAVISKHAPRPKRTDLIGRAVLKNYAPGTAQYGFHFKAYGPDITTPVIRREVRELEVTDAGHYTVYLPAYDDKRIIRVLRQCNEVRWEVFSKHNKRVLKEGNILVRPIENEAFIKSMSSSRGVLCGAGFETPAEALYLKKKLMVIPMKGQYEQHCNAAALKEMGVPVLKSLKKKRVEKINNWLASEEWVEVDYPDVTEQWLLQIIAQHAPDPDQPLQPGRRLYSLKKFRKTSLKKIITST